VHFKYVVYVVLARLRQLLKAFIQRNVNYFIGDRFRVPNIRDFLFLWDHEIVHFFVKVRVDVMRGGQTRWKSEFVQDRLFIKMKLDNIDFG